jgi:hypothetical protein
MRRAVSALALAAVAPLAACTTDPVPEEPHESASVEPERFRIDAEPVWEWTDDRSQVPARLDLPGFAGPLVMITGGTSNDNGPGFAIAEIDTGEFLWALEAHDPIDGFDTEVTFEGYLGSVFAGPDDDPVVVVPYYARGCLNDACAPGTDQAGALGLDPRTGDVRWVSPVDEPSRMIYGGRTSAPVMAAGTNSAMYGDPIPVLDETRTVVLDPADGSERWSADGAWPEHVADPLVVAWTGSDELTLFDLDTGDEIATTTAPFGGTVVHGSRDLLVLETRSAVRLIDTGDGSELAEIDRARGALIDAETGLVVFRESDEHTVFATLMPGETEPTAFSEPLQENFVPRMVADGYVFVHRSADDTTIVVDRTGAALSDHLPGRPLALTDDLLILREGRIVSAYQRTESS